MTTGYDIYPFLKLDHLRVMTDDTGIFHRAYHNIPRREDGYRTDDNAQALSTTLLLLRSRPVASINELALTYMSFLDHALDGSSGRFRNYMTFDRRWSNQAGFEESQGKAFWALGQTAGSEASWGLSAAARQVFRKAMPVIEHLHSPRPLALAMIGTSAYLRRFAEDKSARDVLGSLSKQMKAAYKTHASADWPWPEEFLPPSSGNVAEAMILAGQVLGEPEATASGIETLRWLLTAQTLDRGYFAPIGDKGRYDRNNCAARFDQKPAEAHAMVSACISAFEATDNKEWIDGARLCFEWFLGRNGTGLPLYDPQTGGCCDGITPSGIDPNQAAESTLSWLMSLLLMQALDDTLNPGENRFWFSE